jgi:hypothetical protein
MKIINKKPIILSVLFIAFIFIWWCVNKQNNVDDEIRPVINDVEKVSENNLSHQDVSWLIWMREEEKLSRDVYTNLWKKWETKIFLDVAAVEQIHMDSIKLILEKYWIDDPVKDDSIWIFSSFAIKKLYDDFIFQWNKSLLDAFILAADAESLDILYISDLVKQTQNQDIISLYNTLIIWSRNHLRNYVKEIKDNGGSYKPKYLSQEVYDGIILSQDEKEDA